MEINPTQNFVAGQNHSPEKKRSGLAGVFIIALKIVPWVFLSAVVVALIVGVAAAASVYPHIAGLKLAYSSAMAGQEALTSAQNSLMQQDFQKAQSYFKAAETNFGVANEQLAAAGESAFFKLPMVNSQLKIGEDFAFVGGNLSGALAEISGIANDILNSIGADKLTFAKITAEQKQRALKTFAQSQSALREAKKKIDALEPKIEEINRLNPLYVFDPAIVALNENYPKIKFAVSAAVEAGELAPAFSGYPEESKYLLLLLNNRELRPGGGFIGTYGILKIKDGEIKTFDTDNIYNFDRLSEPFWTMKSPEPMRIYLNQPKWFLRDSNWWPDFPESSKKALEFYRGEGGVEGFDGVIGITPDVMQDIIALIGDVTVDGINFSPDNFWDRLEYEVEYGYANKDVKFSERKDIIADLGKLVIGKLYDLPYAKWNDMFDLIATNVNEKQLMIYFVDESRQKLAESKGFSGQVKSSAGDYVLIADANLAALKTDSVMSRTLVYKLTQDDSGSLIAEARMNYQNLGTYSWKTSKYRSYSRLYAPFGSELIGVTAGGKKIDKVDTMREFNKTVFGVFFEVEPQTSKEIVWKYRLPQKVVDSLKSGKYELLVQKQPGVPEINLQLDLQFNQNILKKENIDFSLSSGRVKHAEELRADQVFTLMFE